MPVIHVLRFALVVVIRAWHAVDINGEVKDLTGEQMWSRGRLITAPVAVATWPDRRYCHGNSGDLGCATSWLVTVW
jgi:hypothetical protein